MDVSESGPQGQAARRLPWRQFVYLAVLAGVGVAVWDDRHAFGAALHAAGPAGLALGFASGVAGIASTFPVWRRVVLGLGVPMPAVAGAEVFFPSQLGKYLPGAVWPIMLQVEAGRRRGAARRTMLAAGMISVVVGVATGLLVSCALLPFGAPGMLGRYWPVLLAVPPLAVLLHPRALPLVFDLAMRLLRRPGLDTRVRGADEIRACGWSLVSWIFLGAQLAALAGRSGPAEVALLPLCVGAMGLAVSAGILFIPAPAGAGIREVILTLALSARMPASHALAVVVASRALLVGADVLLAGVAVAARRLARHRSVGDPVTAG